MPTPRPGACIRSPWTPSEQRVAPPCTPRHPPASLRRGWSTKAVVTTLRLRAVEVAGILDPGVPNVRTIGQPRLVLALKSGNFGSGDALASQPLAPAISRSSTLDGNALNRSRPSKESPFHLAIYRAVAERAGAVVHLHSTHAVALACLQASPRSRWCLISAPAPPSSLLPSARPQREHDCMLLRNHGLVAAGRTIEVAADRAEELDLSARLFFLLRGEQVRALSPADRDEIARFFRRA